ncbi:MAG: hypothetical protein ACTSQH_00095 [Candidatus Hodarchaeales archaeon]
MEEEKTKEEIIKMLEEDLATEEGEPCLSSLNTLKRGQLINLYCCIKVKLEKIK